MALANEALSSVKRVMFYCQHLLGMGHLVRSAEVVRALAKRFSVLFVTGGEVADEFRFPTDAHLVRLTALQAGADFGELRVCDSSLSLPDAKALRCERLLREFDSFAPEALITELYPFGRKQFAFELIPLLERARSRGTAIVSSVRDILVTKQDPARHERQVLELINRYYDLVLVHGVQRFIPLDQTFSRCSDIHCAIQYTGYVVARGEECGRAERTPEAAAHEIPLIVVSNGAGRCASGHLLLESAIRAAQRLREAIPHQFAVFAGPFIPCGTYARLQKLAGAAQNVALSRFTPELGAYLKRADLSISMGGYNTTMDILRSGVRALVYPETANGDREQNVRAGQLESLGVLRQLDRTTLESGGLAPAILSGLGMRPGRVELDLGGAENTALLLHSFLSTRTAHLERAPVASLPGCAFSSF